MQDDRLVLHLLCLVDSTCGGSPGYAAAMVSLPIARLQHWMGTAMGYCSYQDRYDIAERLDLSFHYYRWELRIQLLECSSCSRSMSLGAAQRQDERPANYGEAT